MAVRANRKVKSNLILLAPGVNPVYEKVAEAIAGGQGLTFEWKQKVWMKMRLVCEQVAP